uniref:Uncharacterized protein n=1 Tax=Glossina palpalis gambiensis TaxID=67801 RepID=A0A1B0C662_9MUSC
MIERIFRNSNINTAETTASSPQQLSVTWAIPPCDIDESEKKYSNFLEEKSHDFLLHYADDNRPSSSPVLVSQTGEFLCKYH